MSRSAWAWGSSRRAPFARARTRDCARSTARISFRRRRRGSRTSAAPTCAATRWNSSVSSRRTCAAPTWRSSKPRPARPFPSRSALGPLGAIARELAHGGGALDRRLRAAAQLELQAEVVLAEELREHLAAERAHRDELVLLRVVLEENRRERLRRGAGNHTRAGERIVDAAVGTAGDHLALAGDGAGRLAVADEAHLFRGIGQLVRADRGIGDHVPVRADAAFPAVDLARL